MPAQPIKPPKSLSFLHRSLHLALLMGAVVWCAPTDAHAQVTMTFPKAVAYTNTVPVGWTTSSSPRQISMVWTPTSGGGNFILPFSAANTISSGTFTFMPSTVTSSGNFNNVDPNLFMANGSYAVYLKYVRDSDGNVFNSSSVTLTINDYTAAPIITSPTANTTYGPTIPFSYTLPSVPSLNANAVTMNITGPVSVNMNMVNSRNVVSLPLNTQNIVQNSNLVTSADGNALVDGNYNISLNYYDSSGHPTASTSINNVTIRTVTPTPVISMPVAGATYQALQLDYLIPVAPATGSVTATFYPSGDRLALPDSFGTYNSLTLADPNLASGDYNVVLTYTDALLSQQANVTVSGVHFVLSTPPAILSGPSANVAYNTIPVSFTLGATPLPGSVSLLVQGPMAGVSSAYVALDDNITSVTLLPHHLAASAGVASSSVASLLDGNYTVAVGYADQYAHSSTYSTPIAFVVDTSTAVPTLSGPASNATSNVVGIAYTLGELPQAGSVLLQMFGPTFQQLAMDNALTHMLSWDPTTDPTTLPGVASATGGPLTSGTYSVSLSYRDALGNPAALAFNSNFLLLVPTLSIANAALSESAINSNVWVTLAQASSSVVSVHYQTADVTAMATHDYVATSGTLTWSAGTTGAQAVQVQPIDNDQRTGNRAFTIVLSAPAHALLSAPSALVTLIDADTASVVVTQPSGHTTVTSGLGTDAFQVVLASAPAAPVKITASTGSWLSVQPNQLIFDTNTWHVPQSITVVGPPAHTINGNTTGVVALTVDSNDVYYDNFGLAPVIVAVDDGQPGAANQHHVWVVQPDGATRVTPGESNDTIALSLTEAPTAAVSITAYAECLGDGAAQHTYVHASQLANAPDSHRCRRLLPARSLGTLQPL